MTVKIPCIHMKDGCCVCENRRKKFLFISWIPLCVKLEEPLPCDYFDIPPAPVAPKPLLPTQIAASPMKETENVVKPARRTTSKRKPKSKAGAGRRRG